MTRTNIFAAIALAAAVVSGPVLADTTYYGTADNVPASKEQNNAHAGPLGASQIRGGHGFVSERTYGVPNADVRAERARPVSAGENGFVGTRFQAHDTADRNSGL